MEAAWANDGLEMDEEHDQENAVAKQRQEELSKVVFESCTMESGTPPRSLTQLKDLANAKYGAANYTLHEVNTVVSQFQERNILFLDCAPAEHYYMNQARNPTCILLVNIA